ncbi:hypothetical protein XBFFR1_240004 [Xenorhabdus bovienii str. feltiae France]|nr:hypothetical protein XBFFR1_240004 [Xenorhabdus bovienii str. feltiae France]
MLDTFYPRAVCVRTELILFATRFKWVLVPRNDVVRTLFPYHFTGISLSRTITDTYLDIRDVRCLHLKEGKEYAVAASSERLT